MKRRAALQVLFLAVFGSSSHSGAQREHRLPLVGVPMITAGPDDPMMIDLRRGLRELGYVEGENIRIEHRYVEGKVERLPATVQDLIRLKPDVIVAGLGPIVEAVKNATSTIPIIMVGWDYDPVVAGFVRP